MTDTQQPRADSPKGDHAAGRKREILEAAERVFGRKGYWSATTADIAREVGISQPALYRYFSSKRELFLEALALRQDAIDAAVRDALAGTGSALEKMSRMAAAARALALSHPEMGMLRVQAVALAGTDEEIRTGVRDTLTSLFAAHEAMLEQAIADGSVDPGIDCHAIAGCITSLAFMLYVAISVDHPRAAPDEAGRGMEGLLAAIAPRTNPKGE